jgi:hypothetical protein
MANINGVNGIVSIFNIENEAKMARRKWPLWHAGVMKAMAIEKYVAVIS